MKYSPTPIMHMNIESNNYFNIIQITGLDNFKFLQGQLTANLNDLDNKKYILSSYCNLKGRVISVFYIFKEENNYTLLFLGDTAEIFLKTIKKYAIFSKIKFSEIDSDCAKYIKPICHNLETNQQFLDYLIQNKIPILLKQYSELYLPDNINLLDLKAVSFDKGCFLGQEIIARVYYKGKTKKKLYLISNITKSTTGNITDKNNQHAGEMIIYNQQSNQGLAVIDINFNHEELYISGNRIDIIIK